MKTLKVIYRRLAMLLVLASFGVVLAGCSVDESPAPLEPDSPALRLKVNTRSIVGASVEGVTISSLRLIAINLSADFVTYNKTTLDGGLTDEGGVPDVGRFLASLKPGRYQFYLIGNENAPMTSLLRNAVNTADVEDVIVRGNFGESNLVMYASLRIEIRPKNNDLSQMVAEVKIDGQSEWKEELAVELERVGVKITLGIKKMTTVAGDQFRVKKVEVVQLPKYCYLVPRNYSDALDASAVIYDNPVGLLFDTNSSASDPATVVGNSVIVPEYLVANQIADNAAVIQISATYNGIDVLYRIPVRRDLSIEDYSLYRDYHYKVNLTITKAGDIDYNPYVEYSVDEWTDAVGEEINVGGTIAFTGYWASEVTFSDFKTLGVFNNGYVEYNFILSNPTGATWSASLSNGLDFAFDYMDGAVASGIAKAGHVYKIRVKPLRTVSVSGIQTQFYITVNNGTVPVELDLINGSPGSVNRYVVTQIPH